MGIVTGKARRRLRWAERSCSLSNTGQIDAALSYARIAFFSEFGLRLQPTRHFAKAEPGRPTLFDELDWARRIALSCDALL